MFVAPWLQTTRVKAVRLAAAALAILLFASADAWFAQGVESSQPGGDRPASRGPVHIQSQQLEADMNANTVEFSGQVSVVGDTFTLTADRLSIFFKPQAEGQGRLRSGVSAKDAAKIVARGAVVIRSKGLTASSDAAEYEPDAGRATLWGEKPKAARTPTPRVQGGDISSKAGRPAETASATGRVRVILAPIAKQR